MPAPVVPLRHCEGAAPLPGPMAEFSRDARSVTLGLARLGFVSISADGAVVTGPTADARDATWARLGRWAQAQWFLLQGYAVARGAVVARGDCCVAITGGSQQGASITAASLTKIGWGVVSDGLIVVDHAGVALAREPKITLDTMAADRLFPDAPTKVLPSGRPRTLVEVSGHGDIPLTDIVQIRVTNAIDDLVLTRPGDHANPVPAVMRSQLIPESELARMPKLPNWILARPIPTSNEMAMRVLPTAVAGILDAAFSENGKTQGRGR